MKTFFKELLEYTYTCNEKAIDSLNTTVAPEKAKQLLNHTINAHEVWNARMVGNFSAVKGWEMRPIAKVKEINRMNYETSLKIVEQYDLDTIVSYTNSKGDAYKNSIRDILFHVINHSTYHRGQIATDCKNNGVAPLVSDYIFYKRN